MVRCKIICCPIVGPKLLVHVSLLLVIIAGSGVATMARLKWDPSTYLIFRGLLPTEYRVLSAVLSFASIMMIVLAHLAVFALGVVNFKWRRALFLVYLVLMIYLILVELGTVVWLSLRIIDWIRTGTPKDIYDEVKSLIDTGNDLMSAFSTRNKRQISIDFGVFDTIQTSLSFVQTVAQKIQSSWWEILYDVPFNIIVAIVYIVAAAILQPLAAVLAFNAVFTYNQDQTPEGNGTSAKVGDYKRFDNEISKKHLEIQNKNQKQIVE